MSSADGKPEAYYLLKTLSNPYNLELVLLLSTKPSYTRELSRLTGRNETEVSRRLRQLEKMGIVKGDWRTIRGKSVRVYRLALEKITLTIMNGRIIVSGSDGSSMGIVKVRGLGINSPQVDLLIGREDEVSLIRNPPTPIMVVWGISGIGKTSIVAYALKDRENVFWHTLSKSDSPEYILWKLALFLSSRQRLDLLRYLGAPKPKIEIALEIADESLKNSGFTLVFDDYQDVEGTITGDTITKLASKAIGFQIIIISRRRPKSLPLYVKDRITEIRVKGLQPGETIKLLKTRGVVLREEEAMRIHRETGGHPLLLILYAEAFKKGNISLWRARSTTYLWREIYSSLNEREKRILIVLSAFDEPVPAELIAELSKIQEPVTYLLTLHDKGLVEVYDNLYRAHSLIRNFLGIKDKRIIIARAARYYESLGGWNGRLRAMRYYLKAGKPDDAARLVADRILTDDYSYLSSLYAYESLIKELSRVKVNPKFKPWILHDLALVAMQLGRLKEAIKYLEDGVKAAEILGDERILSHLYSRYSFILSDTGETDRAIEYAEKAIRLAEKSSDPYALLGAYADMAKALAMEGKLGEAEKYISLEEEVAKVLGDPFYTIWITIHKAELKVLMGRAEEAEKILEEARREAESLGMLHPLFYISIVMAEALQARGDWNRLLTEAGKAEILVKELGIKMRSCLPNYYKAKALMELGMLDEALKQALQALNLAKKYNEVVNQDEIKRLIEEIKRRMKL